MNEPSTPTPPVPPISSSSPSPGPAPQASQSAPSKRKRWPWVLGGCGCLTILVVAGLILFGVFRFANLSNAVKRSSTNFNPYKGKLADLLPNEITSGVLKFQFVAKRDTISQWKEAGAAEAYGFTYNQVADAAGTVITVKINGALINFPSAEQALTTLKEAAKEKKATLTAKGNGQRFATADGKWVCWTNGSIVCSINSDFAKALSNFEEAVPF